jgi:EmrB/QacA subfamily drug resistance transporter
MSSPTVTTYPRRWLALAVIAIAQLMIVLDITVVNIALPSAQIDLGITDADRQWVVTAYTLAFGGLLLLGGRISDYWGRKRAFIAGMVGFAFASALGGLATNAILLFAARGLQGAFGALLAPASLALLTVLFSDAKERARAFGVYGAIAGGGSAIGLILGGVLTEYASWRWCLLVNVPVALLAMAAAVRLVPESRTEGNTRYDVPGAVLATLGLMSLVYGFTKAATDGWGAGVTLLFLGLGVAMLAIFLAWETRAEVPLLPLRIILDRNRGGAFLASLLVGVGLFGSFLFLTFYFQGTLGYTPLQAGLAALPVTLGVLIGAGIASTLLPRIGARPMMIVGPIIAGAAMFSLSRLGVQTSFAAHLLPAEIVLGIGMGLVFVPMASLALVGVSNNDAGAASAVLNATQQVGGSLGTALLNTIATTAAANYLAAHLPPTQQIGAEAAVAGYTTAFAWGAGIIALAAVAVAVLVRAGKDEVASVPLVPVADPA